MRARQKIILLINLISEENKKTEKFDFSKIYNLSLFVWFFKSLFIFSKNV